MGSGGATSGQVNTSVGGQSTLGDAGVANQRQQYNLFRNAQSAVDPFNRNLMTNGLPGYRNMTDYSRGDIAQAFAPARANLLRRTSMYSNMPSGYRDAALNNLNSDQARAFDSSLQNAWMANQAAKERGAAGVQAGEQIAGNEGLAYGGQGLNANQSIMGGPRKTGFWGGLGGATLGVLNSFAKGAGSGVAMA